DFGDARDLERADSFSRWEKDAHAGFAALTNRTGAACRSRYRLLLVGVGLLLGLLRVGVAARLEGRAENVAQRSARIGRAVLGDRFLLLGHFQRLDRHRHLAGAAIEQGDAGVDLLADGEPLR